MDGPGQDLELKRLKCKVRFVSTSQYSPPAFRRKENSVERLSWMQWATPYLPVTPFSWFLLQVVILHKLRTLFEKHAWLGIRILVLPLLTGGFFMYFIQHCCICRPSDSTVQKAARIEPGTVATVRRSNHSARTHPPSLSIIYSRKDSPEQCSITILHFMHIFIYYSTTFYR